VVDLVLVIIIKWWHLMRAFLGIVGVDILWVDLKAVLNDVAVADLRVLALATSVVGPAGVEKMNEAGLVDTR